MADKITKRTIKIMVRAMLKHSNTLKRKNFSLTLIVTFLLWLSTAVLVYFVEPTTALAVPGFFILVFFGLLFTFSVILADSRRGLIAAAGLVIFLVLRYFGIGHILNFILILALCVCVELYFNRIN